MMRQTEWLVETFRHDPYFQYLFQNRPSEIQAFFQFLFEKSDILKEWLCIEEREGAPAGIAFIETPGNAKPFTPTAMLKMTGAIFRLLRHSRWQTFQKLNQYMALTTSARPKSKHYYLVMIGVSPAFQRQGIGKALLEKIHAQVDADLSVSGIGLDTENFENVAYYEAFGYRLTAEKQLGPVRVYCLFRPIRL